MGKFNPKEHLIPLKGKEYLQVMWRLVWFREDHPDWSIETEIVEHVNGEYAVFKAVIVESMTEHVVSTGHGSESKKDFADYLEKAETKAVGRALAMLGYGTQYEPDMDEGERVVDSPVERKHADKPKAETPKTDKPKTVTIGTTLCSECGRELTSVTTSSGKTYSAADIAAKGMKTYGRPLCCECAEKLKVQTA